MQNSQINFTSGIKFSTLADFKKELPVLSEKTYVDWPWTANEIIRTPHGVTDEIKNCTAGGIITRGQKDFDIVMFHLHPDNAVNKNFDFVKQKIFEKLNNDKPLQGFLIGSKYCYQSSIDLFSTLESFMENLKIPFSKFRGSPLCGEHIDITYNGHKDLWTIFAENMELSKSPKDYFEKIAISDKDHLIT